jgi:anti-sigma factor RsiW
VSMECDRARALLALLIDRELSLWRRLRLRRHLATCASCATEVEKQLAMQAAFREQITYHRAPPALAARIVAALPPESAPPLVRPWFRMPAVTLGSTGLAGALAGAALVLLIHRAPSNQGSLSVTQAVIDSHIASLMAGHLTDVQTSNQHTVKPWLSAHVDVSPPVLDLAAEGFPLVGGRVDYIDSHSTASVVYRHEKHVINLFAWASPGEANLPPHMETRQGFNVVSWRDAGVSYFAVSDVEADQLERFVQLVRQGSG